MIWDEFLRHFCFCDEEDSGLSDEEQTGAKRAKKSPKAHTKTDTSSQEKLFGEIQNSFYAGKVMFVETNPCTEFWFLLHFLPNVVCRRYESYEQLLPELQKYMPGYEKTKRYFIRTNLYKFLTENGDLERAMSNSEKLCQLCQESPEDLKAYSEIHKVINLLNKIKK